jgi:hypothetical protein|tara:strand:- start:138 stop:680 length:543 start_codon:yes stop_codon:yes gene_type:complete
MKQLDETSFDRPIPGMGMTHELGARPWQTPPTYVTVDEAADYYIEKMSSPEFKNKLLDVMAMKVPLTTVANTMQLSSVMEGLHTVDVGMMMIPILVEVMALIGDSADVDYVTGMDAKKEARPSMINKIIEDMKSEIGDVEDMDEGMEMQQPQEEVEAMPTEETQEEMPMEQPKGLMARRG